MNRNRRLWRVTCPVCGQPVRAGWAPDTAEALLQVGEHHPLGVSVLDAAGLPIGCAGGGAWIAPPVIAPRAAPSYEQTLRRAR